MGLLHDSHGRKRNQQTGAALIVSLIILAVLTLIGVSAMNNSGMEMRMAHNFQLGNYAFQAAESAIENIIRRGTEIGNPLYDRDEDLFKDALNAGINDTSITDDYNPDPDGHLANVAIDVGSTVIFRATQGCPGYGFNVAVCYAFEVDSAATIGDVGASTRHRAGLRIAAPVAN